MRPSTVADILPLSYDPAGFHGEVTADGQCVRVAALACTAAGELALVSLVGYETSVSAALARVLKGQQLGFLPDTRTAWDGPSALCRLSQSYWLWRAAIHGTREQQGVAFPHGASIDHGLRTPPVVPTTPPTDDEPPPDASTAPTATLTRHAPRDANPAVLPPRIVLAPADAAAPSPAAFFGHLKGLRVITLPSLAWVDYLWSTGLRDGLITPLVALGICAWQLDGDPRHWNALVSVGVQRQLLPTTRPTPDDRRRLGIHH
jgi:hypothetical protein